MYKNVLNKQAKFANVQINIADVTDSDVIVLDTEFDENKRDFVVSNAEMQVFASADLTDLHIVKQLQKDWQARGLDANAVIFGMRVVRNNTVYDIAFDTADMQQFA